MREAGPDRGLAGGLPAGPVPGQEEDVAEPVATLVPQTQEGGVSVGGAWPWQPWARPPGGLAALHWQQEDKLRGAGLLPMCDGHCVLGGREGRPSSE